MAEEHPPQSSKLGAHTKGAGPADFMIATELLEVLVCPVARTVLEYDRTRRELISRAARLAYPIRDGVPIMLPEEARVLDAT